MLECIPNHFHPLRKGQRSSHGELCGRMHLEVGFYWDYEIPTKFPLTSQKSLPFTLSSHSLIRVRTLPLQRASESVSWLASRVQAPFQSIWGATDWWFQVYLLCSILFGMTISNRLLTFI